MAAKILKKYQTAYLITNLELIFKENNRFFACNIIFDIRILII